MEHGARKEARRVKNKNDFPFSRSPFSLAMRRAFIVVLLLVAAIAYVTIAVKTPLDDATIIRILKYVLRFFCWQPSFYLPAVRHFEGAAG